MPYRYSHFFHFAIAHMVLYGTHKDFHNVWLRKLPSKTSQAARNKKRKRSSTQAGAAADAEPDHEAHYTGKLAGNPFVLPSYIRNAIHQRAADILWTNQFKKRYEDLIKCVSSAHVYGRFMSSRHSGIGAAASWHRISVSMPTKAQLHVQMRACNCGGCFLPLSPQHAPAVVVAA